MEDKTELKSFMVACQGLVIFILMAALFGHTLAAPAAMIPAITILGMAVSFCRVYFIEHSAYSLDS